MLLLVGDLIEELFLCLDKEANVLHCVSRLATSKTSDAGISLA
jgi:ribonuclease I